MTPQRIQRRRTKGWRMPTGAVYVGRPTFLANPWRVPPNTPEFAVAMYRANAECFVSTPEREGHQAEFRSRVLALRGHDLACWCPLCDAHKDGLPLGVACPDCEPCHADVLLELANR